MVKAIILILSLVFCVSFLVIFWACLRKSKEADIYAEKLFK